MSDVVDLHPARSVEFDDEMEVLANRLSVSLSMLQVVLAKIEPKSSPQYGRLKRLNDRVISTMDSIQTHVESIEGEMDRIFSEINDGDLVSFQTYDEEKHAIVSSRLTTRCHTIRVHRIRFRTIMSALHHNDDFGVALPRFG